MARYLRLLVWWAGNDARRASEDMPPLTEDEIANLRALEPLLDESAEYDRLLKAELLRELGEYEDAIHLLSEPFSSKLAQTAASVRSLAAQRDPFVREMKFEPRPPRPSPPPPKPAS